TALRTDDSVRPATVLQATSTRHPAPTSSGISKSILKPRRPVYLAAVNVRTLKQSCQQSALALTVDSLGIDPSTMKHFPETLSAVVKLLELLRCDHCNSALHQPFTTGLCDHLLCNSCRSDSKSSAQCSCPVCGVPVRPRDFQLHPQIAQLVLVARRLKKLTMNSSAGVLEDSPPTCVESSLQGPLENTCEAPVAESSEISLAHEPEGKTVEQALKPRVVLKRAYSSTSSAKSLPIWPAQRPRVTVKRGISIEREGRSRKDGVLTRSSSGTHTVSIDRQKSRLNRRSVPSTSQSSGESSVNRLPAYVPVEESSFKSNLPNVRVSCTILTSVSQADHIPGNEVASHRPSSARLESVIKAAEGACRTRSSSRRSTCCVLVNNSQSTVQLPAPVASPENSSLTDNSKMSPVKQDSSRTVTIKPAPPSPVPSKSGRTRPAKNRKLSEVVNPPAKAGVLTRLKSSSFTRLVQNLRRNSKGESLLHRAAIRGDLEQVKQCLGSGISPDVRDHAGWTPLHEAVLHGNLSIAEALIDAGATVDIPGGPDLDTPLHDAIQNGQTSCCELLLSRGANPVLSNGLGKTPLQLIEDLLNRAVGEEKRSKRLPGPHSDAIKSLKTVRGHLLKAIECRSGTNKAEEAVPLHSEKEVGSMILSARHSAFVERRRLRPVLLSTGLTRPQQATFARVAAMIHAQVANSISPEVTHVITGATQELPEAERLGQKSLSRSSSASRGDKTLQNVGSKDLFQANCPRTLKFLNAVLLGCWVLTFDWIETCAHVKMRVEEEGFEVTGCSTTPHSDAPRRARLAREAGSLGLFHGFRFCFLGDFVYPVPPRSDLVTLARSGGAVVVFSRDRCSPLRLARLAIEMNDPSMRATWELATEPVDDDPEDSDLELDKPTLQEHVVPAPGSNASSPLLVIYDSGYQREKSTSTNSEPVVPYAVNIVSKALGMLRPINDQSNCMEVPLRAVPSTWLLDCAAEYNVLPLPSL
ncbi:BRCA1-associated RING domain protein 1, partial [Clonorchis sinensis]